MIGKSESEPRKKRGKPKVVILRADTPRSKIQKNTVQPSHHRGRNHRSEKIELRKRNKQWNALQKTVLEITSSRELTELLHKIVERASHLLNASSGELYLCDPENRKVRCVVSYNTPKDNSGIVLDYGEGAAGRVAITGKPLKIEKFNTRPTRAKVFEEIQPFQALISAPMRWQGQVNGVIHILRDKKFTKEEVDLLLLLANHAAVAVENALLHQNAQQELMERKHVEEQMQYQANLLQNVSDAIIATDMNFKIVSWNQAAETLYGWHAEEVMGKLVSEILQTEYLDHSAEQVKHQFMTQGFWKGEIIQKNKDGARLYILSSVSLVIGKKGKPAGAVAVNRDISERKRAEEEQLRLIQVLESSLNEIYMFDKNTLRFIYVNKGALDNLGYLMEELRELTPVDLKPRFTEQTFRDMLSPLIRHETTVHVFETVHRRKDQTTYPVEVHLQLVETGETSLFAAIIHDITERKRSEEALRISEEKFAKAFRASPDIIVLTSLKDGRIREVNDSFQLLTGYDADEVVGKTASELNLWVNPTDREHYIMLLGKDKYVRNLEVDFRIKSGEIRNTMLTGEILELQDGQYILGVIRDITEHKRSEDALREGETRYRQLFESNPHPMWFYDVETLRFLAVNDAAVTHYGYSREEFLGMTIMEIRPPEDRERLLENLATLTEGMDEAGDWRHIKKDGNIIDVEITSHTLNFNGHKAEVVLANDITARKKAEDALREAEAKYRDLVERLPLVVYTSELGMNGVWQYISPQIESLLGFTVQEWMDDPGLWYRQVHPQDREKQEALEENAASIGQPFEAEYRIFTKDGREIWVRDSGRVLPAESGKLPIVQGVLTNVTERKRAEMALSDSEEKYRTLIEQLPAMAYVDKVDGKGSSLFISPQVESIFGVSKEEWVNGDISVWAELIHPEDRQRATDAYLALKEVNQTFDCEYRIIARDGRLVWIQDRGKVLRDSTGNQLLHGILFDITSRKQAEEKLRASEQRLNQALKAAHAGAWEWNMYTNQAVWSEENYLVLGLSPDKAESSYENWLQSVHPDDRRNAERELALAVEQRTDLNIEFRVVWPDGSVHWINDVGKILLDEAGQPTGMYGIQLDITERKQAEIKIRQQLERLDALREIDQAITSTFNMRVSLKVLLRHAASLLEVDAMGVLLLDPVNKTLSYLDGIGFRAPIAQSNSIKLNESYGGRAALERRMVKIPNLAHDPDHGLMMAHLKREGFNAYYGMPLIVKGRVVGVLEVFHRNVVERDEQWLDFFTTLAGQAAIAIDNNRLFEDLQLSRNELIRAYESTIEGWSHALDLRDKETEGHTLRVTQMTMRLAQAAGLGDEQLVHIRRGALLHDIGKMGIPDAILFKREELTDEELKTIHQHPIFAFQLLNQIEYLRPALDIPYCHHEKWDGTGYPRGLKGEQIPLAARLFAVVDVWDALSSDRPYRAGWPLEKVLEHIRSLSGTHFDPNVVESFLFQMEEP